LIISCIVIVITSFLLGINFFNVEKSNPSPEKSSEDSGAGIAAVHVYFPAGYVNLKELAKSNGLESEFGAQDDECVSFCGDNEDSVSMALSAVHRLMETHRITPQQVIYFYYHLRFSDAAVYVYFELVSVAHRLRHIIIFDHQIGRLEVYGKDAERSIASILEHILDGNVEAVATTESSLRYI
jgi:hypothetical protein